jgi:hypothetical protein
MTPSEFNLFSEKYLIKKDVMEQSFNNLLNCFNDNENNSKIATIFNDCTKCASEFITEFELFLTNVSTDEHYLSKIQINDILTSIENILEWFVTLSLALSAVSQRIGIPNVLTSKNYLRTSQTLLKNYRKESAQKLMATFNSHNLSTEGFMSKDKIKFNTIKFDLPSVLAGSFLLIIGAILIFNVGLETGMQYFITRILIALGAGFLISGFGKSHINAEFKFKGTAITSAGAAAVFLILYFTNPAESPKYPPDSVASKSKE